MRIAFSGAHRAGKSTLLAEVAARLPGHVTVDEPYHLLEEEGYEHADPPSLEDFEAQLERSIAALRDEAGDALFDRCPVDVLAYLLVEDDGFDLDDRLDDVRDAVSTLDLVVFVPVEVPDRVAVPGHEDRRWRQAVHDRLEELMVDDRLDLGVDVLTVEGDIAARVAQVMLRLAEG